MKIEGIKERLKEFIWYKGLRVSHFEKMCGLSNGYVASITKGMGAEKMQMILDKFPELSKKWLLKGEGEMLIGQNNKIEIEANEEEDNKESTLTEKLMNELQHLRLIIEKQQSQIDRLLSLIENNTK